MKKNLAQVLLLFTLLIACNTKSLTLDELKKASWLKLQKGVEYISLKNGGSNYSDSIHFSVKGFWGSNITIPGDAYNEIQPTLDTMMGQIVNNKLPQSEHGFLKINLYEMTNPEFLSARIYLSNSYDSLELSEDMQMLRSIKGIVDVKYISKEMAKIEYLDNGNEDWQEILDSNPLPASIEIKLDKKIITPANYESLKNEVKDKMLYVIDIYFPSDLLKKFERNYYILEYRRL